MAANEILPFAENDIGTNLLTQVEYDADAQRLIGNQPGIARAKLVNKVLRQASLITAGLGQWLADEQDDDVTDSLSAETIAAMIKYVSSKPGAVVDSISGLRALLKTGTPRAFVTGYYAAGDGGGGHYYYDASDTTSADNGGSIIVASDGGRWKLAQKGGYSVKQFGVKADGNGSGGGTNNTAFFQAAIDALIATGKSGVVHVDAGTYRLDSGFSYDVSIVTLEADSAFLDFTNLGGATAVTLTGAALNYAGNPYYNGVSALKGFKIQGPGSGVANSVGVKYTGSGFLGSNDVTTRDCVVWGFSTGIEMGDVAYHLSFEHCSVFACGVCVRGQSFTNAGARNVFSRCKLFNSDYAFVLSNASSASTSVANCVIAGIALVDFMIAGGRLNVTDCDIEPGSSHAANYRTLWVTHDSWSSYSYITWSGNQVSVKNATNVPIFGIDGAAILTIIGGDLYCNASCTGGVFGSTGTGAGTITTVGWAYAIGSNPMENYAGAAIELYNHAAGTNSISASKTSASFEAVAAISGPVESYTGVFSGHTNTTSLVALSTYYSLGLGAGSGLLICRDGSLGGTALFACDPSSGVVAVQNNIAGLVCAYDSSALSLQITSGATNRQIRWAFIKVQ